MRSDFDVRVDMLAGGERVKLVIVVVLALVGCGAKRNPDRCCVDQSDCAAIGLPNGSTCPAGELCRGNECVEQTCSASSECDLAAPYCENERCAETCSVDTSCPITSPSMPFCVEGGCVQCRDTADCDDLICRLGRCGNCVTNAECASGLCVGGSCASPTNVAYVTPNGPGTASCTQADPCSLTRALEITPPREVITLAPGNYQQAGTISLSGKRRIAGDTKDNTLITNINAGPVFSVETLGADVALSNVRVFGATNPGGDGIKCNGALLRLRSVLVDGNAGVGLASVGCTLDVGESTFSLNGGLGVSVTALTVPATIDRSSITKNSGGGLSLTGGTVKNSFVVANTGLGVNLTGAFMTTTALEFVTVADNTTGAVSCQIVGGSKPSVSNSIVIPDFLDATSCNVSSSQTLNDAAAAGGNFFFVSPPNDYHIGFGSFAVNRGSGGVGTVDFDGQPRPLGGAADVGADEAF